MVITLICGGLAAVSTIENYLQLVAAFSLMNTDGMPIAEDRGMPWLAAIVPGDASLVEGMALLMSLGFAIGVFFTTRLVFELPAYVMALRQTSDPDARLTLVATAIQKAVVALGLGALLGVTAYFEFELFTLRAIANALGEDSATDTVLNLAPWAQASAEYSQSYALSLARLLPRAYLGVVVIAAALLELSIADLSEKWDQCVGDPESTAEDEGEPLREASDEPAAAEVLPLNPEIDPVDATAPEEQEAAFGHEGVRVPVEEPVQSTSSEGREVRFSDRVDANPPASAVPAVEGPTDQLVEIVGRPGERITLEDAQKDPTLRVDVATRRVWDREFEEQLLQEA
jgi:hypothetical protein